MIEIHSSAPEFSLVAKGRESLEQGDFASAVEFYKKVSDPEALDETEARSMLIEARSHLSRKHLFEALESFEEALLMGTEVQRRQALDGILSVGELMSRLGSLTPQVKSSIEEASVLDPGVRDKIDIVPGDENIVLISNKVLDRLPGHLAKSPRISRLPQHLVDQTLSISNARCVAYADEEDVRFIAELAKSVASLTDPGPES
jgi:hypothetical protein